MKRTSIIGRIALCGLMGLAGGCTQSLSGLLIGSGIGAAAGAGIDHRNRGRGALIGSGIGAAAGYIIGNEIEKDAFRRSAARHVPVTTRAARREPLRHAPEPAPDVCYRPAPPVVPNEPVDGHVVTEPGWRPGY
ncbi:MAG: hypothetical protein CMJ18_27510 [Phycisphaeraceae bacterium]|nr:hypothetical protein [Phycisphaeraceae bacterium]